MYFDSYPVISDLKGQLDVSIGTDSADLHESFAVLIMDEEFQVYIRYQLLGSL